MSKIFTPYPFNSARLQINKKKSPDKISGDSKKLFVRISRVILFCKKITVREIFAEFD